MRLEARRRGRDAASQRGPGAPEQVFTDQRLEIAALVADAVLRHVDDSGVELHADGLRAERLAAPVPQPDAVTCSSNCCLVNRQWRIPRRPSHERRAFRIGHQTLAQGARRGTSCRSARCGSITRSSPTTCRSSSRKQPPTCTVRGRPGARRCCTLPPAAVVRRYSEAEFVAAASATVRGRKTDRVRWLTDFYKAATSSIGGPIAENCEAVRMFRLLLEEYQHACDRRTELETSVTARLATHPDSVRLQTLPGVGPVLALTILAETGDIQRVGMSGNFSSPQASTSRPPSPACHAGCRSSRSAGTRGSGVPSGWRPAWPSACSRTPFAGSTRTTSARIR